jgi:hypothetical protein
MCRRRRGPWGFAIVFLGIIIILALILPSDVWWFLLAVGLICIGVWLIRRCW